MLEYIFLGIFTSFLFVITVREIIDIELKIKLEKEKKELNEKMGKIFKGVLEDE